jgi:ribosomal protein L11 methyltransferase
VAAWLEAVGRGDFVEGVIDGIDTALTAEEDSTGVTDDERFEGSPLALFDDAKKVCENIGAELMNEFGGNIRCAIHEITDESWQQCWREEFTPLQTKKFYIAPLGDPTTTPPGLRRVEIDAHGSAFGTGQHATTRAMIKVLEEHMSSWGVQSVLDVGTGTGIYLILSHILGAKTLAGTEISEELVDLARNNCESAGVQAEIVLSHRPYFDKKFDLVIANILAPVLHDLMADLAKHLQPSGRLLLAGFVAKEAAGVLSKATDCGLRVDFVADELGWMCVVLK